MKTVRRVISITALGSTILWFGIVFGPAPEVRADIYMNLMSNYTTNGDATNEGTMERTGVTLMNLNRIHYRVFQSRRTVHDVLDGYQRTFAPKELHLFAADILPQMNELEKSSPIVPFLEGLVSRTRMKKEESPDWGYVTYFDMGPEVDNNWHMVFGKKMQKFRSGGRLGDLGIARTVVAARNPASPLTTVMSYETDPDFNLSNFEGDAAHDLPGRDIEDLPRISGLRRILTFDQVEDRLGFLMVMYETKTGARETLSRLTQAAGAAGWNTRTPSSASREQANVVFLKKDNAEIQIFARESRDKVNIIVSRRTEVQRDEIR